MTYEIATVLCGTERPSWPDMSKHRWLTIDNSDNALSPCEAYQKLLRSSGSDILIYLHNDVDVHDKDWITWMLYNWGTDCVAYGLGGALALGNRNLYRARYDINNMARRGYMSNQTDAEVHGVRYEGIRRVAVLDAFAMAVRVEWLRARGGWPVKHLSHHCLDLWLACEAARDKKEIWMVGSSCTHRGGGVSTKPIYEQAKWLQGGTLASDHQLPHKWLAKEYADVLPIEVL